MLKYTTELPWALNPEDIERLRGLGKVRFVYEIQAENRNEAAAMIAGEFQGWRGDLGDEQWWMNNMGRGVRL